ncbi:MAG TPA: T9SS type A sorting domain-containing protein [Ignavibacteriaceae bacterium]|nr:T9SS type A sorting domain-containing protein [Ignavibacteriaceae bacterium]
MKKLLLFVIVLSYSVLAQITITTSDRANMFTVGNTTTIYSDTAQSNVDIGSTGGGNNWDFTGLTNNISGTFESVDPSTSSYISDFSGADACTHSLISSSGSQTDIWSYFKLNGTYDLMGTATTNSSQSGIINEIKNNPFRQQYVSPMTYNSNWNQTFTQAQFINGTQAGSSSVTVSALVDAYGTMTLPGGMSYDALRIKETTTVGGFSSVSFAFVAKNGAQVEVSATDSNPSDNGVISADNTSYNGALITTGIEQTSNLPENFNLKQNYPNPFNPSTKIVYTISKESKVSLKIYDILGNEVEALVDKEQPAGVYRVNFIANNLASGLYIAQLKTGSFIKTIKMTLLK